MRQQRVERRDTFRHRAAIVLFAVNKKRRRGVVPAAHALRAAWIILVKGIRDPRIVVAVKGDVVKHHIALDDGRGEIENAIVPYSAAKLATLVTRNWWVGDGFYLFNNFAAKHPAQEISAVAGRDEGCFVAVEIWQGFKLGNQTDNVLKRTTGPIIVDP